jgi:hypothetical protein
VVSFMGKALLLSGDDGYVAVGVIQNDLHGTGQRPRHPKADGMAGWRGFQRHRLIIEPK